MNNDGNNELFRFQSWAEERLNNHLMELNTKYGGEDVESKDLLQTAYEQHREIFNQELDGKISEISGGDNPWLSNELGHIKEKYISRLHLR